MLIDGLEPRKKLKILAGFGKCIEQDLPNIKKQLSQIEKEAKGTKFERIREIKVPIVPNDGIVN